MSQISLFEEKQVRRAWNAEQEKWLFAIVDVVAILTQSVDPGAYWRKLKERLKKEGNETVTNCHGLKMTAADGKQRMTDVADTEQLLRLIQSIPSPKAEPFKLWLAKVGYERLEEIENPELAAKRTREIYEQKGYSEEWIEKRLRGIAVRDELTDEWKKRGVKQGKEFAILTAEISKATFGMTPSEYKDFKALSNPKENLRDHMTDLAGKQDFTRRLRERHPSMGRRWMRVYDGQSTGRDERNSVMAALMGIEGRAPKRVTLRAAAAEAKRAASQRLAPSSTLSGLRIPPDAFTPTEGWQYLCMSARSWGVTPEYS